MPFIKRQSGAKFTLIPNVVLESEDLDLKDIGMLCFLLHLPPTWNFSVEGLVRVLKNNGKTSILSGLKSLEKAGYLARFQKRDNGSFREAFWVVSDTPMTNNDLLEVVSGLDRQDAYGFPSSENQTTGSDTQINTKRNKHIGYYSNKENNKKKDINSNKEINTKEISDFEKFWKAYPKKVGKKDARKAFLKLKGVSIETLIQAVETQKNTRQWKEDGGRYIPNPSTWLHQERWEDEIQEPFEQKKSGGNPFLKMLEREQGGQHEQNTDNPNPGYSSGGVPFALPGRKQ